MLVSAALMADLITMKIARLTLISLVVASLFAVATAGSASAWTLDPAFGNGGISTVPARKGFDGTATNQVVQRPGGGYLVAGTAMMDGYYAENWLVSAFRADGRIDRSFGRAGNATLPANFGTRLMRHSSASAIALQTDGKILIGSTIDVATRSDYRAYDKDYGDPECNCTASRAAFAVIRLHPNGKIDRGYGTHGVTIIRSVVRTWDEGLNATLADIAVDGQGRALVFGTSTDVERGDTERPFGLVYRLGAKGALDKTFAPRGRVLERYPKSIDDVTGNSIFVHRDGGFSTTSGASSYVKNGRQWVVRRHLASGAPDISFGVNGTAAIVFSNPKESASLSTVSHADSGAVTLGGSLREPSFDQSEPIQTILARLKPDGTLDEGFGLAGIARPALPLGVASSQFAAMEVRGDGSMELAETFTPVASPGRVFSPDGDTGLRAISSNGLALTGDASLLPVLGNDYRFWIEALFMNGPTATVAGWRESRFIHHESRITLMRVLPLGK